MSLKRQCFNTDILNNKLTNQLRFLRDISALPTFFLNFVTHFITTLTTCVFIPLHNYELTAAGARPEETEITRTDAVLHETLSEQFHKTVSSICIK